MFTDVAGLLDSKGDLMDFLDCFLMRKILQGAATVRFLVPLTLPQIQEGRGTTARQLVKLLQQICSSTLRSSVASIQPLLTKCRPTDEDHDIEVLRALLQQQLSQEFESLRMENPPAGQGRGEAGQIKDQQPNDLSDMELFLDEFARSLEIFDPLDREVKGSEGENQAVTSAGLRQKIIEMPGVAGASL